VGMPAAAIKVIDGKASRAPAAASCKRVFGSFKRVRRRNTTVEAADDDPQPPPPPTPRIEPDPENSANMAPNAFRHIDARRTPPGSSNSPGRDAGDSPDQAPACDWLQVSAHHKAVASSETETLVRQLRALQQARNHA